MAYSPAPMLPSAPQAAAARMPGAPISSGYGGGGVGAAPIGAGQQARDRLTQLILAQQQASGGQFNGPPGFGGPGAAQGPAPVPGGPMGPIAAPGAQPSAISPPNLLGGPRPGMMAGTPPGGPPPGGMPSGMPPGMPRLPTPGRGPIG